MSSLDDKRPTRLFTDTDCLTHALHLRRDCGESTLMLCKKLGWKEPVVLSDMGSSVYRREDACVTSTEYTSILVNWLQLLIEGKIVAKANID